MIQPSPSFRAPTTLEHTATEEHVYVAHASLMECKHAPEKALRTLLEVPTAFRPDDP
jgi:hypothetical protein